MIVNRFGLRHALRLGIFVLATPAMAQSVSISIQATNAVEEVFRQQGMAVTTAVVSLDFIGDSAQLSNAYVAAEAGFGVARVRSSASYEQTNSFYGFPSSTAHAEWHDTITISKDGLNGSTGRATVRFELTGSGAAGKPADWGSGGDAFASYEFNFTIANFNFHPFGWWTGNGSFIGIPPSGATNWGIQFVYGTPFPCDYWVETHAAITSAGATTGVAEAHADFLREAHWLGFTNVRDGGGNTVSNYTVTSGSGADWSQASTLPDAGVSNATVNAANIDLDVDHLSLAFTNVIQAAPRLESTNWEDVATITDVSGATNVSTTVQPGDNVQFFRIESR